MTAYAYGDTQWSDSDPVVKVVTLVLNAGDELQIVVNTYDPANMWSNPAGTISFNVTYHAHDIIDVEALDATCTADGYTAHKACTGCDYTDGKTVIKATGHTEETLDAVAPGCETTGLTEGKWCSVCETILVAQNVISATGHSGDEIVTDKAPTCTEPGRQHGVCAVCGEAIEDKEIPALGHTEVTLDAVAPTCTETGLTAGKQCSVCKVITVAQQTVDALGHNALGVVEAKAPTCTEDGVVGGTYCTVCNDGKAAAEAVDPATGHNALGVVEAKAPTCTEEGVVGGTYCTVCNDGKAAAEATIDATGHNALGVVDAVAPTCTEDGVVGGTYCTVCNDGKAAAEAVDPATGHNALGVVDAVAPTCTEEGVVGGTYCTVCNDGKAAAEAVDPATGHNALGVVEAVAPTCTEDGIVGGTYCTACNYGKAEAEAVDPATGHTLKDVDALPKTCYKGGYTAHKACTVEGCGYTDGLEYIDASHDLVDVEAKAATCYTDGYNAHKACTACPYTVDKVIAPAGHTGNWVDDGNYEYIVCTTCGRKETREKNTVIADVPFPGEDTNYRIDFTDTLHAVADGGKYLVFEFDVLLDKSVQANTTEYIFDLKILDGASSAGFGGNLCAQFQIVSLNNQVKVINGTAVNPMPYDTPMGETYLTFRLVADLDDTKNDAGNYESYYYLYAKVTGADGPMTLVSKITKTSTYAGCVSRAENYKVVLTKTSVPQIVLDFANASFIRTNDANYLYSACAHEIEETVTPATCTTVGSVVRSCTVDGCGYSVTETIPAHTHGEWTAIDDNYVQRVCECGRIQKSEKNTPIEDVDFPNADTGTRIDFTDTLHAISREDNGGKYLVFDFDILIDKSKASGTTEYITTIKFAEATAALGGGAAHSLQLAMVSNKVKIAGTELPVATTPKGEYYISFRFVVELDTTSTASPYTSTCYIFVKETDAEGPMTLVKTETKSTSYGVVSRYNNFKVILTKEAAAAYALDVKDASFIRTNDTNYLYSACNHNLVETVTPAACGVDGIVNISCAVDGCGYTAVEYIPALSHELSGWITAANGITEERSCANCDFSETRTKGVITFDDGTITAGDAIAFVNGVVVSDDKTTAVSSTGYTAYDVSTTAPGREGDAMLHALYDTSKYVSGTNSSMTIDATGFVAEGAAKQVYTLTFDTYLISPDIYGTKRPAFSVKFGGYSYGINTYGKNVRLDSTNICAHQKWISFKLVYVVTENGAATFTLSYKVEGTADYVTFVDATAVTGSSIKLADAMSIGFEMYGSTTAGYNPEFYMDNISFTTYTAE